MGVKFGALDIVPLKNHQRPPKPAIANLLSESPHRAMITSQSLVDIRKKWFSSIYHERLNSLFIC